MLDNVFCDPRKLFLLGFCVAAFIMTAQVMDYEYRTFDYVFLAILAFTQLALFAIGKIRVQVAIRVPQAVGWVLLSLVGVLVAYNIYLNGLPYLLLNAEAGLALNTAFGDYYHRNMRFTFLMWPLLTVMLPTSLYVRGKILKTLLVVAPIGISLLIQIKVTFLFGFLYLLILHQLAGKKLRVMRTGIVLGVVLLLFLAVAATRTAASLETVATVVGVNEPWRSMSPVVWYPLSYVGGPVVNGFQTLGDAAIGFEGIHLLGMLPSAAQLWLGYQDGLLEIIDAPHGIPWPDSNNAHAAIGTLSHIFGLGGCVLVVFGTSLGLILLAQKRFGGSAIALAFFVTAVKNIAVFQVGNYFIDPSFLGEFVLWSLIFLFADIKITNIVRERHREPAAVSHGSLAGLPQA